MIIRESVKYKPCSTRGSCYVRDPVDSVGKRAALNIFQREKVACFVTFHLWESRHISSAPANLTQNLASDLANKGAYIPWDVCSLIGEIRFHAENMTCTSCFLHGI